MCSFIPVSDTPNGSASSQIVALLDATRGIPPRGRWVDAAAELANPFGESGCRVARSLTFERRTFRGRRRADTSSTVTTKAAAEQARR